MHLNLDEEDKFALAVFGIVLLFIVALCIKQETRPW
jgi:hypothetical protein